MFTNYYWSSYVSLLALTIHILYTTIVVYKPIHLVQVWEHDIYITYLYTY